MGYKPAEMKRFLNAIREQWKLCITADSHLPASEPDKGYDPRYFQIFEGYHLTFLQSPQYYINSFSIILKAIIFIVVDYLADDGNI